MQIQYFTEVRENKSDDVMLINGMPMSNLASASLKKCGNKYVQVDKDSTPG